MHDTETAYLRSVLAGTAREAAESLHTLEPGDFHAPQHQKIAWLINSYAVALCKDGHADAPLEPTVLMTQLVDNGASETERNALIAVTTGNPANPADRAHLATALKTARLRRQCDAVGQSLTEAANGALPSIQCAIAAAQQLTVLAARAGLDH